MCVIVAKPAGIELPNIQTLMDCFDTNSDGAGFMIANGKYVEIRKGFMKFDDFIDALEKYGDVTERSVVMHFRIKTHGEIKPGLCHPFPITDDLKKLSATHITSRVAVAHNGIISGMSTNKDKSDTMAYIAEVITPLRRLSEDFMHNDNALDILEATVGSKLCFMDNSGDIVTIGTFSEIDGVLYSNLNHLNTFRRFSTYSNDVWGAYYEDFYTKYEKEEDELIDQLPWVSCKTCVNQFECAYEYPVCEDSRMAKEVSLALDEDVDGIDAWELAFQYHGMSVA